MMGQDSELQSSLVLVAPMPRRPIALVARRQQNHPARPRASRTIPLQSATTAAHLALATACSSAQACNVETSSNSSRSHPYSRAKTPVSGTSGLGMSALLQDFGPSSDKIGHSRRRSSVKALDAIDCSAQLPAAISALTMSASAKDESMEASTMAGSGASPKSPEMPMLTSPIRRPAAASESNGRTISDVDRTPTKKALREMATNLAPSKQDIKNVELPVGDRSALLQDPVSEEMLTLSPKSPSKQRLHAMASTPRSPDPLCVTLPALNNVVSATPSPSLSESLSRSPSSSPSPCPSPSLEETRPQSPRFTSDWLNADQHDEDEHSSRSPSKELIPLLLSQRRKLGLPLPMPTSPIPRRMTRNPFERSLSSNYPQQSLQQQFSQQSEKDVDDQIMEDSNVVLNLESSLSLLDRTAAACMRDE